MTHYVIKRSKLLSIKEILKICYLSVDLVLCALCLKFVVLSRFLMHLKNNTGSCVHELEYSLWLIPMFFTS